ncbi:unnamed protein product, partial [Rotaria sordida]
IFPDRSVQSPIPSSHTFKINLLHFSLLTDPSSPYVDLAYISDEDTLYSINLLPIVHKSEHQTHSASSLDLRQLLFTSRKHARRSTTARVKRNKKHNKVLRLYRYTYSIIRNVYHRFTMKKIKHLLHQHRVHSVHVKHRYNHIIIGVTNSHLQEQFDRQLPLTIFNRQHYYYH